MTAIIIGVCYFVPLRFIVGSAWFVHTIKRMVIVLLTLISEGLVITDVNTLFVQPCTITQLLIKHSFMHTTSNHKLLYTDYKDKNI